MLVTEKKTKVVYGDAERYRSTDGLLHRFINMTVTELSEKNPEISIDIGKLAVKSITNITPQPLGDHFSVVWDGDKLNPKLRFDGQPDSATVRIEVWGK